MPSMGQTHRSRLLRWVWIGVAALGGSLFLLYFLADRMFAALIVALDGM